MNLEKIIEEIYDKGPAQYPAYSAAPRKDFAPISSKDGYNYPNQRMFASDNYTSPSPDASVVFPWPLQTITDDLSDSFVYLTAGMSKIAQCIKNNPTINVEQKTKLIELFKHSKKALELIKNVGLKIGEISNIAEQQPSQNPVKVLPVTPPNPTSDQKNLIQINLP